MRKTKFPKIIYLLIGIPASSLVTGIVLIVAAHQTGGTAMSEQTLQAPLNKVSWRTSIEAHEPDQHKTQANGSLEAVYPQIKNVTETPTQKGAGE